jgi:hypothetical protein
VCVRKVTRLAFLSVLLFSVAITAFAQEPDPNKPRDNAEDKPAAAANNADALRKAAQNPVASLISVPVQENWYFNIGTNDRIQNVLNVQPVIPINLTQNWNLIIRWIALIIYQPLGVKQPPPPSGPDFALGANASAAAATAEPNQGVLTTTCRRAITSPGSQLSRPTGRPRTAADGLCRWAAASAAS